MFEKLVRRDMRVVVELGSWCGLSASHILARAESCTLICVDHWKGSPEHFTREDWKALVPHVREIFLKNLWPWRHRVIPMCTDTMNGLLEIAELSIQPDLIYVDAGHAYGQVLGEITFFQKAWPTACLMGHDYVGGVKRAVDELTTMCRKTVVSIGRAWTLRDAQCPE
jgi:hypothetical protein